MIPLAIAETKVWVQRLASSDLAGFLGLRIKDAAGLSGRNITQAN